jgi:hypothetical protein
MMHRLWRVLLASAGGLAAWAPPLLIAVLGWNYVHRCTLFLESPGMPALLHVETPDGPLRIETEAFSLRVWDRQASLYGLRVTDPHGELILATPRAVVQMRGDAAEIRMAEAELRLERLGDGELAFDKMKGPGGKGTPLNFECTSLKLDYIDRSGLELIAREFSLSDVSFSTGEGAASARFDVETHGVPRMPLRYHAGADSGYWVSAEPNGLDVAELLPLIENWIDLEGTAVEGLSFDQLILTGDFTFERPVDGGFSLEGDLNAEAVGLAAEGLFPKVNGTASLVGSDGLIRTQLNARRAGLTAGFDGVTTFRDGFAAAGTVVASAESDEALWPAVRGLLPEGSDLTEVEFAGRMNWGEDGILLEGDGLVSQAGYEKHSVQNAGLSLAVDGDWVTAHLTQSEFMGEPVSGSASVKLSTGDLKGMITTEGADIGRVASELGLDGLTGASDASAILLGTLAEPKAELLASGAASYTVRDTDFDFTDFHARASYSEGLVTLQRFGAEGPNGTLAANGTYQLDPPLLDVDASVTGAPVAKLLADATGTAYADIHFAGELAEPDISGRVEVYELAYGDAVVPQLLADFTGDIDGWTAQKISAQLGAGRIDGSLSWLLEDDSLAGEFRAENIEVSDWARESASGQLSADSILISGTLAEPQAEAAFEARSVVAGGMVIDSASASAKADLKDVTLTDILVSLDEGRVTGAADYSFEDQKGVAVLNAEAVPLDRIAAVASTVSLGASVSGDATVNYDQYGLSTTAEGSLNDTSVSQLPTGSGSFQLAIEEGLLSATASLGSLERYLNLDQLEMDFQSQTLQARGTLFNFGVAETVDALFDEMVNWSPDLQDLALSTEGSISSAFEASGRIDDPDLHVESLSLSDLNLRGRQAGTIEVEAERLAGEWHIATASWESPGKATGVFSGRGVIGRDGSLDLFGDLTKFDLAWMSVLYPKMPDIIGTVGQATVLAKGSTDAPELQASAAVEVLGWIDSDDQRHLLGGEEDGEARGSLNASLQGGLSPDRVVTASGILSGLGFEADLELDAPLDAFVKPDFGDNPASITASLDLKNRPVSELTELIPALDPDQSTGTVHGSALLTGSAGAWNLEGTISAAGEKAVFAGLSTSALDYKLDLSLQEDGAMISSSAVSSLGGSMSTSTSVSWPSPNDGLKLASLLSDSEIDGVVRTDGFMFNEEREMDPDYAQDTTLKTSGRLTGEANLSGSLEAPRIGGDLRLSDLVVVMPSSFGEPDAKPESDIGLVVDNLIVRAARGARIEFPLGYAAVHGMGTINGTLSTMKVSAPVEIEEGELKLPSAPIDIEQGGKIDIQYDAESTNRPVRVDVDMKGSTAVTARSLTGQFERFNVELTFRGDLLDPAGLNMDAYSEPPDLTKDQILGILGQQQLFEALGGSIGGGGGNRADLSQTLLSLAVPTLTSQITRDLATSLRLDYISFDYNPFDLAMIRAGKTLGPGLMLHGATQVNDSAFGGNRYELKMVYRLPSSSSLLSRVRLGLGTDHFRPWKITFDWSKRF